jgi:hypothetical protein
MNQQDRTQDRTDEAHDTPEQGGTLPAENLPPPPVHEVSIPYVPSASPPPAGKRIHPRPPAPRVPEAPSGTPGPPGELGTDSSPPIAPAEPEHQP